MDDLTTFLRARLDEDELGASAASPGPWHVNAEADEVLAVDDVTVADGFALSGQQLRATTRHIARHDPARILREVDAKRRLVDEHKPRRVEYLPRREPGCLTCSTAQQWDERAGEAHCLTLRLLALPYAAHPDYRDDCAP